MTPYRIQRHRKRKHTDSHMALVPFIDMLTILVVFLLVHTSDVDVLPNTKNITIPQSISDRIPNPTVVVMITKDDLLVDGKSVATMASIEGSTEIIIPSLRAALKEQGNKVLIAAADPAVPREVTIMGDRNTPYTVLKKVMATCTDADYGKVSLAVLEREGPPVAQAKPTA
ncbi:MAG TPA: biopolymer transporter ExbD [Steroidobacteraceae bacterium]|nr:biopolymer transporter ExbD [Steroidobacteraceae bacterium]